MKKAVLYGIIALVIVYIILYFTNIKPHQVKADCYNSAYAKAIRSHENDGQWAPGKVWTSDPNYNGGGDPVTDAKYVWAYPDQDINRLGEETRASEKEAQDENYNNCLHSQGY